MMRRFVGAIALAAVVTTGAQAQFLDHFTFGDNGDPVDYAGYYGTFDATASDALTGRSAGTAFQVFCADEFHFSNGSASGYDVWVTPISSGNFANTREVIDFGHNNAAAYSLYLNAAALASAMTQVTSPPSASGSTDNTYNSNLQFAIWDVLGYPGTPPCSAAGVPAGGCLQGQDPSGFYGSGSAVTADETAFTPATTGISANQWLVITAESLDANGSPQWQEFLYYGKDRTFETPVPEPGTMAMLAMGLVGMAGAGLRRRKIKK